MTVTIARRIPDLNFSIRKHFETFEYAVGATVATFKGHFPGLVFRAAYPDDLLDLKAPTLAFMDEDAVPGQMFFGEEQIETEHSFSIFGFVVGQGSDGANRAYRDRLANDLFMVLTGPAASEGMDLYSQANPVAVIGGLEVDASQVRKRMLPVNAPRIEVDRYKFVVEFVIQWV